MTPSQLLTVLRFYAIVPNMLSTQNKHVKVKVRKPANKYRDVYPSNG